MVRSYYAVSVGSSRYTERRTEMRRANGEVKVLATYPSSSGGRDHEVRLGGDGVVYCTCPGWRFHTRRWCKHLEDFTMRQVEVNTQQEFKEKVVAGSSVEAITQQVIEELKGAGYGQG
jgi:hypothetical protein